MRIGNFDLKDKIPAILQKEKKQESFQEEDVPEKPEHRAKKAKTPLFSFSKDHAKPKQKKTPSPRRGRIVVPVGIQTVVAVLICCGVCVLAGIGLLTSQQLEIASLKNDLKTYVDDGVVPANSMADSLSLNLEAVAARVANLQTVAASATNGKLSNDDLQWFGTELDEVQMESQMLNNILNDTEADKAAKTAYKDKILNPLVEVQSAYDNLKVEDSAVADTGVENGAATDTGAFKSSAAAKTGVKWALFIIIAAVVVAAVLFLLRHRLADMLYRGKKAGTAEKKRAEAVSGDHKRRSMKKPVVQNNAASNGKRAPKEKKSESGAKHEKALPKIDPSIGEETVEVAAEEISEEDAFYENLAPTLRKMAEEEKKNAEDGAAMPVPSAEDLLTFDATVESQEEIEEDDDSIFTKSDDR